MDWMSMLRRVEDIVHRHGFDCKVTVATRSEMMAYHAQTNTITFNATMIKRLCDKYNATVQDMIEVMTCHELGHHVDYVSDPMRFECASEPEREMRAWELGKAYVPGALMELYEWVNEANVKSTQ